MEIMFKILPPFVKEQLRVGLGENWEQQVVQKFKDKKLTCVRRDKKNKIEWIDWDFLASLHAILIYWNDIFKHVLGEESKTRVQALKRSVTRLNHHQPCL